MPKPWPDLRSDEAAEDFVATADLTEYDVGAMRRVRFVFAADDEPVEASLPAALLASVKTRAAALGVPYQRFIRLALRTPWPSPDPASGGSARSGRFSPPAPPAARRRRRGPPR